MSGLRDFVINTGDVSPHMSRSLSRLTAPARDRTDKVESAICAAPRAHCYYPPGELRSFLPMQQRRVCVRRRRLMTTASRHPLHESIRVRNRHREQLRKDTRRTSLQVAVHGFGHWARTGIRPDLLALVDWWSEELDDPPSIQFHYVDLDEKCPVLEKKPLNTDAELAIEPEWRPEIETYFCQLKPDDLVEIRGEGKYDLVIIANADHAHLKSLEFWLEDWNQASYILCLLYTSPSPRDKRQSRMPSSA